LIKIDSEINFLYDRKQEGVIFITEGGSWFMDQPNCYGYTRLTTRQTNQNENLNTSLDFI
jgi:hypothetical protein